MGQEVKDHLRLALSVMLKPLVRLLIAQGVTHAEFSETAKEVYVEIALRHFETEGKVNKSRVAILTGLTRKEVKNVVTSDDGEPSFVALVKNYSGDMAPRQMLNQLLEAGSVLEIDGRYKAVSRIFLHKKLSPSVVDRLGSVGYRFFSTAAKNIDADREGGEKTLFDRMVFADDGCTDEVISQFSDYLSTRGQSFLEELDVWFSTRKDMNKPGVPKKETGVYMLHYVEERDDLGSLRVLLQERGVSKE